MFGRVLKSTVAGWQEARPFAIRTSAARPGNPSPSPLLSTRTTTCYAYRVEAGPYFVPGLPRVLCSSSRDRPLFRTRITTCCCSSLAGRQADTAGSGALHHVLPKAQVVRARGSRRAAECVDLLIALLGAQDSPPGLWVSFFVFHRGIRTRTSNGPGRRLA